MKIIFPIIGTRGNLQPHIALSLGLKKAGHTVTLATPSFLPGLVESYGVTFAPMGPESTSATRWSSSAPNRPNG